MLSHNLDMDSTISRVWLCTLSRMKGVSRAWRKSILGFFSWLWVWCGKFTQALAAVTSMLWRTVTRNCQVKWLLFLLSDHAQAGSFVTATGKGAMMLSLFQAIAAFLDYEHRVKRLKAGKNQSLTTTVETVSVRDRCSLMGNGGLPGNRGKTWSL